MCDQCLASWPPNKGGIQKKLLLILIGIWISYPHLTWFAWAWSLKEDDLPLIWINFYDIGTPLASEFFRNMLFDILSVGRPTFRFFFFFIPRYIPDINMLLICFWLLLTYMSGVQVFIEGTDLFSCFGSCLLYASLYVASCGNGCVWWMDYPISITFTADSNSIVTCREITCISGLVPV